MYPSQILKINLEYKCFTIAITTKLEMTFIIFLFENQIIKDVKDCNLIFKIIEEFKNDKKFNILIRPHPNENPNDYLFLETRYRNVFIDKSSEFKDWIKKLML